MTTISVPTNIDDAFCSGWWFGRGYESHFFRITTAIPVHIRAEYERGVYEGHRFQQEWNEHARWEKAKADYALRSSP